MRLGELLVEVQTFSGEAVGLLGFAGRRGVRKINITVLVRRAHVIVGEDTPAILLKTQIGYYLSAWQYFLTHD